MSCASKSYTRNFQTVRRLFEKFQERKKATPDMHRRYSLFSVFENFYNCICLFDFWRNFKTTSGIYFFVHYFLYFYIPKLCFTPKIKLQYQSDQYSDIQSCIVYCLVLTCLFVLWSTEVTKSRGQRGWADPRTAHLSPVIRYTAPMEKSIVMHGYEYHLSQGQEQNRRCNAMCNVHHDVLMLC